MKKFFIPRNYAQYAFTFANKKFLGPTEAIFAPKSSERLSHPCIFILGAPRSGSTLAIQVITDALDIGYMNNQHCSFFGAPVLAERFFCKSSNRAPSDYQSIHGKTTGRYGPAECGQWWYRFFRQSPPYVTLGDVDPKRMRKFRVSIAALTAACNRPILFKNLYASLRIQAIAHYLPESLFIIIHRNEVENGHSLLEARYKRYLDYTKWFSVEPPNVEELKVLPVHQQVIEQIRHIHITIDKDLRKSGVSENRRLDLCYEKLCANPDEIIRNVHGFLAANGCVVNSRENTLKKFTPRQGVRIDPVVYERMLAYSNASNN